MEGYKAIAENVMLVGFGAALGVLKNSKGIGGKAIQDINRCCGTVVQ